MVKNMEINKTIYKLDSKGRLRFLKISTSRGKLIQESGLIDGESVIHESMCKSKNIGRSNSTTIEEQSIIEANAKIAKKIDEGYFYSKKEAFTNKIVLPMLAKSFNNESKKIDWANVYVQPKLDGMRCLMNNHTMISRKNKPIITLPHIMKEANSIIDWLDGELYAHGKTFQENMKIIKKNRPESINVKYHVYDMVYPDLPFIDRYIILKSIIKDKNHIELVPTYKVETIEEIYNFHNKFLSEGYEGTMIRWGNEGYKINGRSSNLLKYKDFIDESYDIVDIVPSDRNPKQGVVHCKLPDGRTFGCGMKFSHEEREEILTNKEDYIGKYKSETRFFEFSDDGIPRFPICFGFRLDK